MRRVRRGKADDKVWDRLPKFQAVERHGCNRHRALPSEIADLYVATFRANCDGVLEVDRYYDPLKAGGMVQKVLEYVNI